MAFSRMDRVQNLLRGAIAEVIDQELDNPALPPFITIYRVKVSKDLRHATVLVTFLEDTRDEEIKATVDELNRSAGYIGRLVAQRVQLRRHPQLRFAYNGSTHYALEMEKIFQQIHHDDPQAGGSDEPDEGPLGEGGVEESENGDQSSRED